MSILFYKFFLVVILLGNVFATTLEGMSVKDIVEGIPESLPKIDRPAAGAVYLGCRSMNVNWDNFGRFEWCVDYFVDHPKDALKNTNFIAKAGEWLHYIKQMLRVEIQKNQPLMDMLMLYADAKKENFTQEVGMDASNSGILVDPLDISDADSEEMGLSISQLSHTDFRLNDGPSTRSNADSVDLVYQSAHSIDSTKTIMRLENTVAGTVQILENFDRDASKEKPFSLMAKVISLGKRLHSGLESMTTLCSYFSDDGNGDGFDYGELLGCLLDAIFS